MTKESLIVTSCILIQQIQPEGNTVSVFANFLLHLQIVLERMKCLETVSWKSGFKSQERHIHFRSPCSCVSLTGWQNVHATGSRYVTSLSIHLKQSSSRITLQKAKQQKGGDGFAVLYAGPKYNGWLLYITMDLQGKRTFITFFTHSWHNYQIVTFAVNRMYICIFK